MVSALQMRELRKIKQFASGHTARKMRLKPRHMIPKAMHTSRVPLPQPILVSKILKMGKLSPRQGWRHVQCHLALWNQN